MKKVTLVTALVAIFSSIIGITLMFSNCARINVNDVKSGNIAVTGQGGPTGTMSCKAAPICSNPPSNCQYVNQVTDANGCSESCGELKCDGPIECPMIACAPPNEGCYYNSSAAKKDANGCPIDCGPQVCDEKPDPCPLIACAEPPEGCRVIPGVITPENKCPGCGTVVCDEPPKCENAVRCVPPAEGCRYVQDPTFDEKGCQTSCGEISCIPKPVVCPAIDCAPLEENGCSYPNKTYDEKGCLKTCGPIHCPGPIACPMIGCLEPEEKNCQQTTPPVFDQNGCIKTCGVWTCGDTAEGPANPPKPRPPGTSGKCPKIGFICPTKPGCYWDPRGGVNENGCQTGCGTLICREQEK
jgi:hypothetical protein